MRWWSMVMVCAWSSAALAQRAAPVAGNPDPDVRRALEAGAAETILHVRVAIDTLGQARVLSLRSSLDAGVSFVPLARQALSAWSFTPASRDGQRVADTIDVDLQYLPAGPPYAEMLGVGLIERVQSAPGRWRYTYASPRLAHDGEPTDSGVQRLALLRAFAEVTSGMEWIPLSPRYICIEMPRTSGDAAPTPAELTNLARPGLMFVDMANCPKDRYWLNGVTYEAPATRPRTPNNERAPRLSLQKWIRSDTGGVLFEIRTDLGGGGDIYACFVAISAQRPSVSRCARRGAWMS